jgi:hypothetical protein
MTHINGRKTRKQRNIPFPSIHSFHCIPHTPPQYKTAEPKEKKISRVQIASRCLCLESLVLLLLLHLQQQGAVDVREDTTKGNRGADERVEFFVSADSQLQVAGGNALDFEILGGVLRKLA